MNKYLEKIVTITGGLAVGFINGFFGGGGGMLCVPLLEKVLKRETKLSHATAILIILPISLASAITYIISGYFDLTNTLITSIGVIAGGVGGAFLLKVLPTKIVGLIFALMMIGVGVKLTFF